MRLPEKLMGYVEYEGVNYPFNFGAVKIYAQNCLQAPAE